MQKLRLGSLFDGIGGFPLAAAVCGIEPVWASEIESFPIEVTRLRFPGMLHVGDITKLRGAELPPVDIVCGGSPCQDLSIAGLRAGLAGARSGLFMGRTFEQCWRKQRAWQSQTCQSLDLRPGHGNLLGAYWEEISPSHGRFTMQNFSESPKDAAVSSLSQILLGTVPQKYYLSAKACRGILRRSAERGKTLPPQLESAVRMQAGLREEQEPGR